MGVLKGIVPSIYRGRKQIFVPLLACKDEMLRVFCKNITKVILCADGAR